MRCCLLKKNSRRFGESIKSPHTINMNRHPMSLHHSLALSLARALPTPFLRALCLPASRSPSSSRGSSLRAAFKCGRNSRYHALSQKRMTHNRTELNQLKEKSDVVDRSLSRFAGEMWQSWFAACIWDTHINTHTWH